MATAIHCHLSSYFSLPSRSSNDCSSSKFNTFRAVSFSSNLFSKGGLPIGVAKKPTRQLVVCMARRYASNSRKRKIMTRRKGGGDPDKKKKRRRKGRSNRKTRFKIIKLVSSAGTGFVYAKRKGVETKKLEIRKFDPRVNRHVLFKETK